MSLTGSLHRLFSEAGYNLRDWNARSIAQHHVSIGLTCFARRGQQACVAQAGPSAAFHLTHNGVKVYLPDDDLSIATWLPVYAGVNWHEREAHEMFGITFVGHPHLVHLYLPGEFEARDVGSAGRRSVFALALEDVGTVHAGGSHPDEDLPGLRLRPGAGLRHQGLRPSRHRNGDRGHAGRQRRHWMSFALFGRFVAVDMNMMMKS